MKKQIECDLCGSSSHSRRYRFNDLDVVKCNGCGLVYVQLYENADAAPKMVYSADYFKDRGEYFLHVSDKEVEEMDGSHIDSFRDGLNRLKKQEKSGTLLDVGCAVGVFLSMAEKEGWGVSGVDVSEYAVSRARKRCSGDIRAGELDDVHFPDASFDVITMWDVVEHFPHPSEALREAHRILKDDGMILMDTPNEEALIRKLAFRIYRTLGGLSSYPAKKLYHRYHLYYFSEKTLTLLLDKCGFEAIEVVHKPIPREKGRGNRLERFLVMAVGALEKPLGMDYEVLVLARKKRRKSP